MTDKSVLASESMVSRLSKLLNQAERAEEGSPEREAFMEKALQLSSAYSIDLAVARAHQAKKERIEEPERRTFKVGDPTARGQKNAHFADLMIAICNANDIRVVIGGNQVFVHGTGMPSDLDMAERLFAILSVQMVQEADRGIKNNDHKERRLEPKLTREEIPEDERAWGKKYEGKDSVWNWGDSAFYDEKDEELRDGYRLRPRRDGWGDEWVKSNPPPKFRNVPVLDEDGQPVMEEKWVSKVDARIWRANFYQGFVTRTLVRLREVKKAALKDAGIDVQDDGDSRAVALRDKAKEVREAFEENEKFVLATGRTYGGAEVSRYDSHGRTSGHEAGSRARLGNEKDLGE